MTYNVFGGTLNLALSIYTSFLHGGGSKSAEFCLDLHNTSRLQRALVSSNVSDI